MWAALGVTSSALMRMEKSQWDESKTIILKDGLDVIGKLDQNS